MASPGPSKRPKFSCTVVTASHAWELEARRELAMWRKRLQPTKGLIRAYFLVECAKSEGVNLETLLNETSVDEDAVNIQKIANLKFINKGEKEYETWEGHVQRLEQVVYSSFLLNAAKKMGINPATLAKDPLSLYKELLFVVDVACQVAPPDPTPLICEACANCIQEENNTEEWTPSFPIESSESAPPSPSRSERDGSQDLFEQ